MSSTLAPLTIPEGQEPEKKPATPYVEPEPPQQPQEPAAAAAPQEPAKAGQPLPQGPRRPLPPDFDEKMLRFFKARADVLQTSRFDDMGRVVRPAIPDPNAALAAAIAYFPKFMVGEGMVDQIRTYLDGGEMPKYWVPVNTPSKAIDGPAKRQEMFEFQAMAGREQDPVRAAVRDYVIDPVGNIVPGFLQVFADTYVGLANFVTDVKPVDMRAMLTPVPKGSTLEEELAKGKASAATAGIGSKILRGTGKLGGELPAYLQGGVLGAPKAIIGGAGKVGAAVGGKVAGKVAGKVGASVGQGAAGFGALGFVQDSENRLAGLGMGAASGVLIGASSELAKATFRGMFRNTYQSLGKTEQEAMDALKKWANEHGVYKLAGDTEDGYVRSLTSKFVDAGMPGVPKMGVKKMLGYAVQGGIESVGFSALDHEFWHELHEGNVEALAARLGGSALALGAFHVPLKDVPAGQRRGQIDPQGAPVKPVETPPPQEPTTAEPKPEPMGGIGGEVAFTKLEGEAPPQAIDPATLKAEQEPTKRDRATGTVMVSGPTPLARLGWREVFTEAPPAGVAEIKLEQPLQPVEGGGIAGPGKIVELPGTPHSYTVTGTTAEANPSLAKLLGIREPLPVETMEALLEHASLLSALESKKLPGTEINSNGTHAVGTDGTQDGVQRVVRMGEVLEAPLVPEPKWTAIDKAPQRGKDYLDPPQQQVVAGLKDVLTQAEGLPQADRVMLSTVVDVLDTVSARNDQSVAETLAAMPKVLETMGQNPTPEQASRAIKAVAEMLTVKLPERAIADIQPKAPENRPETANAEGGFVDVGAAAESVKKAAKGPKEVIGEALDSMFRDQIDSIEARGGDPELAQEMRRIASTARTTMGKVMDTFSAAEESIQKHEAELMELIDVRGVAKPRWDALLHREIEPATPEEAQVADVMNKTLLELWEIERQSGAFLSKTGPEGETVWFERSANRDQAKLPRAWAEGKQEVYRDPALRQRWFDKLAELNPLQIREKGVLRQRTGADFEAEYQKELRPSETKQAERESSFEHVRTMQNVPYEFEGHEMLERNPFEVFRRVITEQASRAATIREVGQEGVPEEQQKAARTRLGLNPEMRGVTERLQRWFATLPTQEPGVLRQAAETFTRLQGKEPKQLGRIGDKVRRAQGIRRAAMTMLSGLRDIPSMFTEGARYGGFVNMAKAFGNVMLHYPEAKTRAARLGTLINEIGNLNINEATDPLSKAADWLGEFGNVPGVKLLAPRATERFRTVMMSKVADLVLRDWGEGLGTAGSRQMLRDFGFKEPDAIAIASGQGSEALNNRFRHQLVQRTLSRGRSAERSRFAADPRVQALVDFTGYAAKRAYGLAREAKLAVDALKPGSDATLADKAAILKQLTVRATGLVAGGMLGDMLYYIVADALEGKNGWNRYMRDLMSYPAQTLTRAGTSGLLSGPLAVLFRAATSSRPVAESAAQLTVPTSIISGMLTAAHDATTPKGWLESAYDLVASTGVIPQASRLKSLAGYLSGVALNENTEFREDAKLVSQFRQNEGIVSEKPRFDKQPAFYAALGSIREAIDHADMKLSSEAAAKDVRAKADKAIREALALQPEENVAAAVRGMQHAENVDKQRLLDYVRDEKRFERMMAHDQMVSELAEAIGKEQGTNPTPFEERLAGAAKLAAANTKNAWTKLVSDTIEDEAVARKHGQPVGTALRDLANRMSLHQDSVLIDDTLGDKDKKAWKRMATQGRRERFLLGVMRERVNNKLEDLRARR